jgi:hypothetical protein
VSRDETPIYHRSREKSQASETQPVASESAPVPTPAPVERIDVVPEQLENAPVVVDLPDGQKVLLGSIEPGTVIEIAAWRGTERPDSRTTRIVLGVATNPDLEKGSNVNNVVKPKPRRGKAWIWIVASLAIVGAVVLALLLSPLKFVHPTSGISLGFGSADSAVVVVVPVEDASVGQLVVASKGDEVIVGQVSGKDSGRLLLQTGASFTQVPEKAVFGLVTVIIPFVGLLQ